MSEPASQPGAPSDGATKIPPPSEKTQSITRDVEKRLPTQVTKALKKQDGVILRLNKLLNMPGGLSAFLSTFNYTLYLLAHLDSKAGPLKARLYQLLNRNAPSSSVITPAVAAQPSPIAALGSLLSSTRTTLRLFGLIPMYAWARQLAQGPKPGQDQVLYTVSVAQCGLYIAFQLFENVALLTDSKVLSPSLTARWTQKSGGATSAIYLASYRAWFLGFCCDFIRLFREAQLAREAREQPGHNSDPAVRAADEEVDSKWWAELIVPIAWFPVGFQFAQWREGGFPGFNLGLMGAAGAIAGLGKTKALWDATA
ncbi:unnamed protein product [Zymoseptoria tritici ST99CH_3D1]|nr:unnamed protein product [Zymoseptoria tritici ST99CH_3D1]